MDELTQTVDESSKILYETRLQKLVCPKRSEDVMNETIISYAIFFGVLDFVGVNMVPGVVKGSTSVAPLEAETLNTSLGVVFIKPECPLLAFIALLAFDVFLQLTKWPS